MREIERRAAAGDEDCRRALALYAYRVRKYIGAYAAVMGGVDAIAFTGGVGENSATIRQACLERLEFLGAAIVVVRADEELAMALEAAALLGRLLPLPVPDLRHVFAVARDVLAMLDELVAHALAQMRGLRAECRARDRSRLRRDGSGRGR